MILRNLYKLFVVVLFLLFSPFSISDSQSNTIDNSAKFLDMIYGSIAPARVQMDYYINRYAAEYNVPLSIAYKVAKLETGYKGPSDQKYIHNLTSSANAEGPFQIMLPTAKFVTKNNDITRERLRNDIQLNAMISMKFLRQLYDTYHNWEIALGYYNTGYPIINEYAKIAAR